MGAKRPSIAPLVILQMRRLCLGFPGLLFVVSLLGLRWSWGRTAGYGDLQDVPLVRLSWALQQGAWLWVLWAALQLGIRLRQLSRKEANWLSPLGVGPGAYVLSLWLGTCLATGLAMTMLFVVLVASDDGKAPSHAIERVIHWKTDASIAPGQALQHELDADSSDALAILVRPTVGADPTTAAMLTASKDSIGIQSEARVDTLKWLTVALPEGPEPVRISLANRGGGRLGILGTQSLVTLSTQNATGHWLGLGLRAWLWAGLMLALVVAACTWLRPTIAIPLALLLGVGIANATPGGLAAWPEALAWQRVSMGASPLPWPAAALAIPLLIGCWFLARRGLRAWGIDR